MLQSLPVWALISICIICWGSWAFIQKLALHNSSPMMIQVITAYVYSGLAPLLFLAMKAADIPITWNRSVITWATLGCLLAVTAGVAFTTAIQKTPVHYVVCFTSAYPILTYVLCTVFLGEPVTIQKFLGIIVVVAGLILITI